MAFKRKGAIIAERELRSMLVLSFSQDFPNEVVQLHEWISQIEKDEILFSIFTMHQLTRQSSVTVSLSLSPLFNPLHPYHLHLTPFRRHQHNPPY